LAGQKGGKNEEHVNTERAGEKNKQKGKKNYHLLSLSLLPREKGHVKMKRGGGKREGKEASSSNHPPIICQRFVRKKKREKEKREGKNDRRLFPRRSRGEGRS